MNNWRIWCAEKTPIAVPTASKNLRNSKTFVDEEGIGSPTTVAMENSQSAWTLCDCSSKYDDFPPFFFISCSREVNNRLEPIRKSSWKVLKELWNYAIEFTIANQFPICTAWFWLNFWNNFGLLANCAKIDQFSLCAHSRSLILWKCLG